MFPRSYNSFNNGPKSPLTKAWLESPKSSVNPVGATTSPKLKNLSFFFAIPEILLEIPIIIDVDPNEVLSEILNFIVIDFDEIVEVSNSQFDPQVDPPRKKQKLGVDGIGEKPPKKSYNNSRKFQAKWVGKLPWAKGLMAVGGIIWTMRCKVCSFIENKDKIIKCKWDILTKHDGYRIVIHDLPRLGVKKGGEYIAKDCAHLINMRLWAQQGPNFVLQQVNKPLGKGNQKIVQFKSLFHILFHG